MDARFRLDVELSNNLPRKLAFGAAYLPQMQVAGQPWAKDAAIPVITLNAFNPIIEPNNPYRECTWSWTSTSLLRPLSANLNAHPQEKCPSFGGDNPRPG